MKDLAPDIKRQRFLIEGFFFIDINEEVIKTYFLNIAKKLNLRIYGEPIIFSPNSLGKEDNQGYDAFVPLIDSGISLYIWSKPKFLSCIIYTCKDFSEVKALEATKDFFQIHTIEAKAF